MGVGDRPAPAERGDPAIDGVIVEQLHVAAGPTETDHLLFAAQDLDATFGADAGDDHMDRVGPDVHRSQDRVGHEYDRSHRRVATLTPWHDKIARRRAGA